MAQTAVTGPAFTVLDLPAGERNLIGLARVSTDGQDAQLQQDALTEARCARIYTEKISTRKATTERLGLTAALDYLRTGDTLVVWKLDRLGRSVKDVLTIADDLHARGIGVRILTGKLSGSYSPSGEGKFFFTMMAAFAELERDIIHERTMAGLVAAKAQGRNGGRPTVMDEDKLAAARARRARGESPTEIARALGVSRASVYRHLAAASQEARPGRTQAAPCSVRVWSIRITSLAMRFLNDAAYPTRRHHLRRPGRFGSPGRATSASRCLLLGAARSRGRRVPLAALMPPEHSVLRHLHPLVTGRADPGQRGSGGDEHEPGHESPSSFLSQQRARQKILARPASR